MLVNGCQGRRLEAVSPSFQLPASENSLYPMSVSREESAVEFIVALKFHRSRIRRSINSTNKSALFNVSFLYFRKKKKTT